MRRKRAVKRWELGCRDAVNQFFRPAAVRDKVGDRDQWHIQAACHFGKRRETQHLAIIPHNLTDHTNGLQPTETHKVNSGFRVAWALQNAALATHQGIHMPGAVKVLGCRERVCQHPDRLSTVMCAATGCRTRNRINGNRKRSPKRLRVFEDHQVQTQLPQPALLHRDRDDAASLTRHEGDSFARDELSGHHEIAFVFPVFVIH